MTKVGFVGAGKIGANAAYASLFRVRADEVAIVDLQKPLAEGEAMDLNTAAAGLGLETRVVGGDDYGLLAGADVVVVSAGLARKPGMTREDLLLKNAQIIGGICKDVYAQSPDAQVMIVTNPVDPLVYLAREATGADRSKLYGMGALHDSMRLWDVLRDQAGAPVWSDAWILGPHGEAMFPAQTIADTGGKDVDWADVKEKVRGRAASIIERKGATYYAPGIAISQMVAAAVGQTPKQHIPVVACLEGEYGLSGVALGVPAVLGRRGVERVVEVPLGDADMELMRSAAKGVQDQIASVQSSQG